MSLSLVLILLTNCSQASSRPIEAIPCGVLIPYTEEFQQEASEELINLDGEEGYQHIVTMVNDYAKTRKSIRTCLNAGIM